MATSTEHTNCVRRAFAGEGLSGPLLRNNSGPSENAKTAECTIFREVASRAPYAELDTRAIAALDLGHRSFEKWTRSWPRTPSSAATGARKPDGAPPPVWVPSPKQPRVTSLRSVNGHFELNGFNDEFAAFQTGAYFRRAAAILARTSGFRARTYIRAGIVLSSCRSLRTRDRPVTTGTTGSVLVSVTSKTSAT
jgi:hypothetical protein